MEDRTLLSTFVVSNTGDSGSGSLRQALVDCNAATGATNTIDFDISGTGVQTIEPASPLPAITQAVRIDGFSQPGYSSTPLIELSGSQAGGGDGLTITGSNVTVRGLDINNFSQGAGIHVTGNTATGDWIYGNFLGSDPTGTQADPNNEGVEIDGGATQNLVGTNGDGVNDTAERNIISGNLFAGVWITGQGTSGNAMAGNFIGTDITGMNALGNSGAGLNDPAGNFVAALVVITGGASNNRIGTDGGSVDDAGERNVIAGSQEDGVDIADSGTDGNIVAGNFIGTDVTGTAVLGNASDGVYIVGGASSNWIGVNPNGGTAVTDEGNVISRNGNFGVHIDGSDGNVVEGNVISGNRYTGVVIDASDNVVARNKIGTDATGTVALGNRNFGVEIGSGSGNTIGGTTVGAANVISANQDGGVFISGKGTTGNVVQGNLIGTDITGTMALGNPTGGVEIFNGAASNTIGGTTAIAGNLIAHNGGPGVIVGADTSDDFPVGDQITANRIFGNTGPPIDLGDTGVVTYNSNSPRQGANDLQNFPIILAGPGGRLQGWLGGSLPNTTFRIDVFASAGYGPGDSSEAQDYLGSLEMTTGATGQVSFAVPFTAPAGLPIITATATDPQGNTSEVTSPVSSGFHAATEAVRLAPGQESLVFSPASGDGINLQDSGDDSPGLTWDLSVSVPTGTLALSSTAGLAGSGDGTGSLFYSGTLPSLDAAIDGMSYTPPPGFQGNTTLNVTAQSGGIALLVGQVIVTTGSFAVTTISDSGPGSLRQAILDANGVPGLTVTIDFDIPGAGVQTIEPITPLPPITAAVLIDGTTQPGFAGTPLIAFGGSQAGSTPLAVSSGNVTIRGLALGSLAIDATMNEGLMAVAAAPGATSRLSLLDAAGHVLVQSEGVSADNPDLVIDEQLTAGVYSLALDGEAGQATSTWSTMLTPADSPFLPIPVGFNPKAIVTGDFSGNGHLDLAVTNIGSNDVSVLLANGDGTFQPQVTYAVGTAPVAIVAGAFTGDGRINLAVANAQDDTVSVLLGNGDGTFQPQITYAVGLDPQAIVAGDFTGSGRLDLAVANGGDGTVSVLLGNGDGTFQPQATYVVGSGPDAIATGRFTGDGHLDLAVANEYSNDVSLLLGNGDGTFQPQLTYAVGSNPSAIVAGDFAGDGRLDLAVANSGSSVSPGTVSLGTVSVLLGNGDGTFQSQVTYPAGSSFGAIVAGDFTGDGKLDLAVTGDKLVSVLLGNGDGTFQPQVIYAVGNNPDAIVAGDFNGDGRLDLAVVDNGSNEVSVLLGKGDGTFQSVQQYEVGLEPDAIVAGDFTGDGRVDLAVAIENSNGVSVLLGNGDGTFQPPVTYAVGNYPDAIVAGDFNGDGRLDLAVANYGDNTVSVLLGNGNGTFQPARTIPLGDLDPNALVAGDFNGDGRLDLAVASYNESTSQDEVAVLLGDGDGTFEPPLAVALGGNAYLPAIVAGDFTGDGHLDVAGANSSDNTVLVLLGNGDGTFQPPVEYPVGLQPEDIVAGDFTGNGRLDLAVTDLNPVTYGNEVSVLLGNGDGTFQPRVTYNVPSNIGLLSDAIVAGDFTGNGRLDLAVTNDVDATVSVLLGNGDGTFQPQVTYAVGNGPDGMVTGDFTGDGKIDLAVVNGYDNDVSVLLSNGDGTFSAPGQSDITPMGNPVVVDVNGDGTDDALVVDGAGNILYRQGIPGQPGTFEPPVTVNPPLPDGSNPDASRDIAWLPNTDQGPVLASVDAKDNTISFYAYRDGGFVRLNGSLTTGGFPAQIIAADLSGDGLTDLVVRNAGDGTLSVYLGSPVVRTDFIGPVNPQFLSPSFLPPVTLPVGIGVSDVQAVDTTGSGALDLVITNKLTSQASVLLNQGNGTFAAPVIYRAGPGLSAVDPGSTPEVTSLDGTAGVAAGSLTAGGPTSLVTINPGSNTLDVLAGLGGGRFANPSTVSMPSPTQVVRMADFTGNGIEDLAVLATSGVSIYLGNGKGRFHNLTTYVVPSAADGLTLADISGDGKLDLLVGDAYGDVLVLLGKGDGTFAPYHEANQAIELAVADLTGTGSKDIIYADQGLDRVVVDYGAGSSSVLANQSTGLLDPGAVKLADLNGDGIPDLIVANSGSNNVLIYPGLGHGQFGPAINGGHGYFVGTNPVGITVANLTGALPDLVIADKGSNDVSVLVNQSQSGNISFEPAVRFPVDGSGPVATAVQNVPGGYPNLLVSNSGSNNVTLIPGSSPADFNVPAERNIPVGDNPGQLFVGNFNGQTDLVTVNAGSNDLTLISGFGGPNPVTSTIASGGVEPDAAFAFTSSTGFEDLVVGNAGDGELALFEGGPDGLSLTDSATEPNVPEPTALAFSALTGGQVQFYAATAGSESAELVALSLGIEPAPIPSPSGTPPANPGAQLVALNESSLPLVATVLTLTITVSGNELNLGLLESEAIAVAAFLPGTGISVGQGVSSQGRGGPGGDDDVESDAPGAAIPGAVPAVIAPWERFVIGLEEALEKFQQENPNGVSGAPARDTASDRSDSPAATAPPAQGPPTSLKSGSNQVPSTDEPDQTKEPSSTTAVEAIDTVISSLWGQDRGRDSREQLSGTGRLSSRSDDVLPSIRLVLSRSPDQGPRTSDQGQDQGRRTNLLVAGFDLRTGAVLPPVPEPGKDEPDLTSMSLAVAILAGEWGHARRVKETTKPIVGLGSQGPLHVPASAKLRPSRSTPPYWGRRRSVRAALSEHAP